MADTLGFCIELHGKHPHPADSTGRQHVHDWSEPATKNDALIGHLQDLMGECASDTTGTYVTNTVAEDIPRWLEKLTGAKYTESAIKAALRVPGASTAKPLPGGSVCNELAEAFKIRVSYFSTGGVASETWKYDDSGQATPSTDCGCGKA